MSGGGVLQWSPHDQMAQAKKYVCRLTRKVSLYITGRHHRPVQSSIFVPSWSSASFSQQLSAMLHQQVCDRSVALVYRVAQRKIAVCVNFSAKVDEEHHDGSVTSISSHLQSRHGIILVFLVHICTILQEDGDHFCVTTARCVAQRRVVDLGSILDKQVHNACSHLKWQRATPRLNSHQRRAQ